MNMLRGRTEMTTEKKCGVRIVEGLADDHPVVCELPEGHADERHSSTAALKARVSALESALRGVLEHCSCQGRGYRSWDNMRVVKPCQSMTCRTARHLLGIPDTEPRYGAID